MSPQLKDPCALIGGKQTTPKIIKMTSMGGRDAGPIVHNADGPFLPLASIHVDELTFESLSFPFLLHLNHAHA
jgi:hypothetical protein